MKHLLLLLSFLSSFIFAEVTVSEGTLTLKSMNLKQYLKPSTPYQSGFPYQRIDIERVNNRCTKELETKTLYIENEYLKLTILPEYGGRVYQAVFKPTGQDMLFNSNELKVQEAMGSTRWMHYLGGIKYAFPTYGHSPNDINPWEYEFIDNKNGSKTVFLKRQDLETGLVLTQKITLKTDSSSIFFKTKLENPTPHKQKYMYWICTAVEVTDDVEFIFPATEVIQHEDFWGFPERAVISWPTYKNVDYSFFKNWREAEGLFPLNKAGKVSFIGAYDHGKKLGIIRSFPEDKVKGTKLWTFGKNDPPYKSFGIKNKIYYELFGGILETQDEYEILVPGAAIEWEENWYPLKNTGAVNYANSRLAIRASRTKENTLKLCIYADSKVKADLLTVKSGNFYKEIKNVEFSPDDPVEYIFDLGTEDVKNVEINIPQLLSKTFLWKELKND